MTLISIIRLLQEIRPAIADKQKGALLDQAVLELRLMPNPHIRREPQPIPTTKLEAVVINLENRMKGKYGDIPRSFWTDLKKELPMLMQIEKL